MEVEMHMRGPVLARIGLAAIAVVAAIALALPAAAAAATQTLTVEMAGSGTGSVTSSPAGISCGGDCSHAFAEGTAVLLTGAPGANTAAVQWSGCDSVTVEKKCMVTMSEAKAVTATFPKARHLLKVDKRGTGTGTVTSSPEGIDCGATCSVEFDSGTEVTLTAAPGPQSAEVVWGGCASVSEGTCHVTMSGAETVTATFTFNVEGPLLTVVKAGTGAGTVTSSPAGLNCGGACSVSFLSGTKATLTGFPKTESEAVQWTGCEHIITGDRCEVTMSEARSVTAVFELEPQYVEYSVTVLKVGTGSGTVTASATPPGGTTTADALDCGSLCTGQFVFHTDLTLFATPAPGSVFTHWSGGGCSGSGVCEHSINSNRTIKARFTAVGNRALTVSKAGTGQGTVTSAVAGIECGSICSAAPATGTKVVLAATADSGSTFAGWKGCGSLNGVGKCVVTMNEARNVTATFSAPPAPSPTPSALSVSPSAKVKGKAALLKVSCKGSAACKGTLELTLKGKVIGSSAFDLSAGASSTLKVKLSAKARRQLKARGKLQAKATGTGVDSRSVSIGA